MDGYNDIQGVQLPMHYDILLPTKDDQGEFITLYDYYKERFTGDEFEVFIFFSRTNAQILSEDRELEDYINSWLEQNDIYYSFTKSVPAYDRNSNFCLMKEIFAKIAEYYSKTDYLENIEDRRCFKIYSPEQQLVEEPIVEMPVISEIRTSIDLDGNVIIKWKATGVKRTYIQKKSNIINDKYLYKIYIDSVITERINLYKKNRSPQSYDLPFSAIYYHTEIAYPEGYETLKELWITDLKNDKSPYFLPLVKLGDPDAKRMFDSKVDKFVRSNGMQGITPMELLNALNFVNNSYSLEISKKLLVVDLQFEMFSEGEEIYRFNCVILGQILDKFRIYNLSPSCSSDYRDCSNLRINDNCIKSILDELIRFYIVKEQYWRDNLPYNN